MQIRAARADEHAALTAIALEAKAHWGYAPALLARWRAELTVTRESIGARPTFVAELAGVPAGFCQLDGGVLEHLWVRPAHIGGGIGRALLARAQHEARAAGHAVLRIDADPHAEAFYRACGAVRTGEQAAPIDGDAARVRPQLELPTGRTASRAVR